ncbi:MAG: DUF3124 domain-containing protein, partial [Sandaracinaceae bacterium]|nr:DUF3124 domain-containing protein [Sandaracinaceae bacterium]
MQDLHRYGWAITIVVLGGLFGFYVMTRPEPAVERLRFGDEPSTPHAAPPPPPPRPDAIAGRTYVSAYSHAYIGSGQPVLFAITLSVRNVDPQRALVVRRVDYHGTDGARVRAMIEAPRTVPPLGTLEVFVDREDESGGSGASFLVEWDMEPGGHRPLCEAVMLGSAGPVGYSFTSIGVDASDPLGGPASSGAPSSGGEAPPAPRGAVPAEPAT